MSRFLHLLISFFIFIFLCPRIMAQQSHEKMVRTVNYLLYFPDGYKQDSMIKWPLLIFLHGSGERGTDLEKIKVHGPPKLIEQGKKLPFIVVSPQAGQSGWQTQDLYDLVQDCKQNYRVDPDRVYLTGLSMGGFGTWELAMKHPEEFAAIVPICGGGDTSDVWKLRNMPVWCFHGAKDSTVPIEMDRKMIRGVRTYNPSARFTVYPEAGHDCWTVTYNNDSLYQWLLGQKRFHYKEVPVAAALLKEYAGAYVSSDKDTVLIHTGGDTLFAQTKNNNQAFPLKACSDSAFFIDDHTPVDIHFNKNTAGRTIGFVVYADKKMVYKKIKGK